MSPEQVQEIVRLRALNLSPKQIARKLGLRPTEVNALLRKQAEEREITRLARGELPPLERCLINSEAAKKLLLSKTKRAFGQSQSDDEGTGVDGLAQISLVQRERNQYF